MKPLLLYFSFCFQKVAAAAGLKENPQRRTEELIKHNDPAGGMERLSVRNTSGTETGV